MKEKILKWLTISFLSVMTIVGLFMFVLTIIVGIDCHGDTDPNPMSGIGLAMLVAVQIVGLLVSVFSSLYSYSSYSDYYRLTLIPLCIWD